MNVLGVGGTLKFTTDAATYSASLEGAPQALQNLGACDREAGALNAAHQGQSKQAVTSP
jgi:hypothetical protein